MKKPVKQAINYSNLSQWIQTEIWLYADKALKDEERDALELADRIIKQVLEDKNLVNNRIHKEGFDAGYKKGRKDLTKEIKKEYVGSDLEGFLSAHYETNLFINFLEGLDK